MLHTVSLFHHLLDFGPCQYSFGDNLTLNQFTQPNQLDQVLHYLTLHTDHGTGMGFLISQKQTNKQQQQTTLNNNPKQQQIHTTTELTLH